MNQKGISAILIISIVVGVLAIGGGVWYWQSQKKEIKKIEEPTTQQPTTPSITVISPNGGGKWIIGKTYDIKWRSSVYPSGAEIKIALQDTRYDPFSESPLGEVIISSTQNTGSYIWTISSKLTDSLGRAMELGAGNVYKIVLYSARPGGECEPEKCDTSDATFSIVKPEPESMREIQLFYYNRTKAIEAEAKGINTCNFDNLDVVMFPVKREIPLTKTPIRDTIKLLLEGKLTIEERNQGFYSHFPLPGFKLLSVDLKDGVLTLEVADPNLSTSCGSCCGFLVASSIRKTIEQFPEVKEVKFESKDLLFQP